MNKQKNGEHPVIVHRRTISFGARASDVLTLLMGSWTFIIFFALFLLAWMLLNVVAWAFLWDPYPFILFNLLLSSLATF